MAANKRFVAKNGIDNNGNTIANVAQGTSDDDVATRGYARDASNIDIGTLNPDRLALSGVLADTYGTAQAIPILTIDNKGRVTSATSVPFTRVTNFTYDQASTTFTIFTGDGTQFPATIPIAVVDNAEFGSFSFDPATTTFTNVSITTEEIQDVVGGMFTTNSELGLITTYNDTTGKIDIDVNDFTISLSGDLSGSATISNLSNATIVATINPNSINLGTDTVGDYVATASVSGIGLSGSATGEGSNFVVTSNATSLNTPDTLVSRNANGDFNTRTINLEGGLNLFNNANYITFKDTAGGSPRTLGFNAGNIFYVGPIDAYAGGSIIYGVSADVSSQQLFVGGTQRVLISSTSTTINDDLNVSGVINRSPTITLAGDLSGSVTLTDLQSGTLNATINPNSVTLGTDTTGNYVGSVAAGAGIVVSGADGEGVTKTVAHADTSAQASVNNSNGVVIQDITLDTFGHITAIGSIDLDGRYYTETESDARFVNVTGDTITGVLTSTYKSDVTFAGQYTVAAPFYNVTSLSGSQYQPFIKGRIVGSTRTSHTSFGLLHNTDNTSEPTVHYIEDGNVNNTNWKFPVGAGGFLYSEGFHPEADTLTTPRTIALSGDVVGSVSFDGSANVTIATTIQPNSITLGTDTTGNYVATGATSGNGISGSATGEGSTFIVTSNATPANTANTIVFRDGTGSFNAGSVVLAGDITVNGGDIVLPATANIGLASTNLQIGSSTGTTSVRNNLTVSGNLVVNGSTTTVNSTVTTINDPIITVGNGTTVDDNKDRGVEFKWNDGGGVNTGFFGFDDSTGFFTFIPDGTNSGEVFSGAKGVVDATRITGTASAWTTARTITLAGDLSGSVSIDGSTNVTLSAQVADNSHNHTTLTGVTSLSFSSDSSDFANIQSSIVGGTTYLDINVGDDLNSDGIRLRLDYFADAGPYDALALTTIGNNLAKARIQGDLEVTRNGLISGDLTVNGGDIIIGGTGRIQGIDTVTAATDATNKAYVDEAVGGPSVDNVSTSLSAPGTIYTFSSTTYRTAKLVVQATHASGFESIEVLIVHDGTDAYIAEYANIQTNGSLFELSANVSGSTVILTASPVNTATAFKVVASSLVVI